VYFAMSFDFDTLFYDDYYNVKWANQGQTVTISWSTVDTILILPFTGQQVAAAASAAPYIPVFQTAFALWDDALETVSFVQTNEGNSADVALAVTNIDGPGAIAAFWNSAWSNSLINDSTIRFDLPDIGPVDLLTTALHEIGNILGLGDIWPNPSILSVQEDPFPQSFSGNTLWQDDLDFIRFHYGETWGTPGADDMVGDGGVDVLVGDGGNDTISGNGANDLLSGKEGNDTLDGGSGDDSLMGGAGVDFLYGGFNDDTLEGGAETDALFGQEGADVLHGQGGDDGLDGGAGNDTLEGGDGVDWLFGRAGDDVLLGGDQTDALFGNEDNDRLEGQGGDDGLDGGSGNDTLEGGTGVDWLYGSIGNDVLYGATETVDSNDTDALFGEEGNDTLYGGAGGDGLDGGAGDDELNGGDGVDWLFGQGDNDTLNGGDGSDVLFGGDGNDVLSGGLVGDALDGGAGMDTLDGGAGVDILFGGTGADTFVFNDATEGEDLIRDFITGEDRIELDAAAFGIATGNLAGQGVWQTDAGLPADFGTGGPVLYFDTVFNALFFDPDGGTSGNASALFALETGTLNEGDIWGA
jgi:Ca2+-binding RTX toxin-like protein